MTSMVDGLAKNSIAAPARRVLSALCSMRSDQACLNGSFNVDPPRFYK